MRDSTGGMSDLDDMDDIEMIMQQLQYEQEQEQAAKSSHRRNYIYREREDAEERLMADYFGAHPKYPLYYFRKRYCMSRKLFLEIVACIENYIQTVDPLLPHFDFLRVRPNATGLPGALIVCTENEEIVQKNGTSNLREKQESARKDIERAFGVLQGRWHIICQTACAWTINKLRRVMYICIILHNMILKDQKNIALTFVGMNPYFFNKLCKMDELVKVGQTMGYNMEGCMNNIEAIIGSQGDVNFLALQETKMESIDLFSINSLWGKFSFDHAISSSVGNSGGILCVWEPNLIIRKKQLWEYLSSLVNRWDGESVLLGYFNEVRTEHERFGTSFNNSGAHVFNNFISGASLIDLPLGGYTYTWAHKLASKMSKLDQFLVTEGLMLEFPHLSAICLDKHLSDHHHILMRELNVDYGVIPFRVFHSWFNMEGFDKMVENSWKNSNLVETNGMVLLKKKLQMLKEDIKLWSKEVRKRSSDAKLSIQKKISDVDKVLDQGGYSEDNVKYRSSLLKDLQDINSTEASDIAQKAKVQWSLEGDENSKYFHGILNKKRYQLAIRGVLADGEWIDDPCKPIEWGFGVHSDEVYNTARIVGCSTFSTPFNYLGVKVGGTMSKISSWDEVISNVKSRLSKWKLSSLSIGGRLSLLKSVISSIPLYHMSIFKVPFGVINHLESIRRNFFNGVDGSNKKMVWISWKKVLMSKKKGGLGLTSLFALNRGLMFKWLWRFKTQSQSLWTRVIKAIVGNYRFDETKETTNETKGSKSSLNNSTSWWRIMEDLVKDIKR
ncbi:RNA-directed DNA polymerase, eukaryota [Tanacetum coccineum]